MLHCSNAKGYLSLQQARLGESALSWPPWQNRTQEMKLCQTVMDLAANSLKHSGARIQGEPAGLSGFWCSFQSFRMALATVFAVIGAAAGSSLRSASASSRENTDSLDG
jgi:hypothetical protein